MDKESDGASLKATLLAGFGGATIRLGKTHEEVCGNEEIDHSVAGVGHCGDAGSSSCVGWSTNSGLGDLGLLGRRTTHRRLVKRRTVVRVLVGIVATVIGMLVGFSVAATGLTVLSDDEVSDAAHTLVPPGWTVEQVIAGRPSMPFGGLGGLTPYQVFVDATAQPAPHLERLAEAEATAEGAGWEESSRSNHSNGVGLNYNRGALTAHVIVFKTTPDLVIRVEKDEATVTLHRRIGAVIGGVLALGGWIAWRRRKPGRAAGARSVSP